jgi:hypothetical protein
MDCAICGKSGCTSGCAPAAVCAAAAAEPAATAPAAAAARPPTRARVTHVIGEGGKNTFMVQGFDPMARAIAESGSAAGIQYVLPDRLAAHLRVGDIVEYVGDRAPTRRSAADGVVRLIYRGVPRENRPRFIAGTTIASISQFVAALFGGGAGGGYGGAPPFTGDQVASALQASAKEKGMSPARLLTGASVALMEVRRRNDASAASFGGGAYVALSPAAASKRAPSTPVDRFAASFHRRYLAARDPGRVAISTRQIEYLLTRWAGESVRQFLLFGARSIAAAMAIVGRARWGLAARAHAAVAAALPDAVGPPAAVCGCPALAAVREASGTGALPAGVWCVFHDAHRDDARVSEMAASVPEALAEAGVLEHYTFTFEAAFTRLAENPYAFVGADRLTLEEADEIALANSSASESEAAVYRECAELVAQIERGMDDHVVMPRSQFFGEDGRKGAIATCTFGLIATAAADAADAAAAAPESGSDSDDAALVHVTTLSRFFALSTVVARLRAVAEAAAAPPRQAPFRLSPEAAAAPLVEGAPNTAPSPEQLEAIEAIVGAAVAKAPAVVVVTGGPGMGKTALCRGVVRELAARRISFRALAPTGKAVSCICAATRTPPALASTVHRALNKGDVSPDVVILDESSMLDTALIARLFRASRSNVFAFIGDADQLPPIEWGHVFHVLCTGAVPGVRVVRLTQQFRSTAGSAASLAAVHAAIRSGAAAPPNITTAFGDSVRVVAAPGPVADAAVAVAAAIARSASGSAASAAPHRRIAVISPLKRDCDAANAAMRSVFVPESEDAGAPPPLLANDRVRVTANVYLSADGNPALEAGASAAMILTKMRTDAGTFEAFAAAAAARAGAGAGAGGSISHEDISRFMRCTRAGGCRVAVFAEAECSGCESAEVLEACTGANVAAAAGLDVMNGETGTVVSVGPRFVEVQFDSSPNRVIRFANADAAAAGAGAAAAGAGARGRGGAGALAKPARAEDAPARGFCPEGGVFDTDGDGIVGQRGGGGAAMAAATLSTLVLQHAFAITVHRAQGSEYDHVVLAIGWANRGFLSRALFYTAATRARVSLQIIFSADEFGSAAAAWNRVVGSVARPRDGRIVAAVTGGADARGDAEIIVAAGVAGVAAAAADAGWDDGDGDDGAAPDGW